MKNITNNVLNSIFTSLLVFTILMAIAFFVYDLRTVPDQFELVKSLKYEYLFKKTLVQSLGLFPVVVIFTYIFAFTVLFTLKAFQTTSYMFHQVAVPAFILLLVMIMLIIGSQLLFIPNLQKRLALLEYHAHIAGAGLSRATELGENRRYREALEILEFLLEMDEGNTQFIELRDTITANLANAPGPEKAEGRKTSPASPPDTPSGYYERGRAEYERGNYHEALFYLERALRLTVGNKEAAALYERAKREVNRELGALTAREKEMQRMVQQKERGITHLNRGEYYEAYDILLPLSAKYPKMKDLALYLKTAETEILNEDFSVDELRRFDWFPSRSGAVFIDREGYIDTVEKIISHKGFFYFYNVTRYMVAKSSPKVARFKYGKWIEGRPGSGKPEEPTLSDRTAGRIRLKNDEGFVKRAGPGNEIYFITPYVLPGYLEYSGNPEKLKRQMNVFENLAMSERLRAAGFDVEGSNEYLAKSVGPIFSVYAIALLLAAFAWSRRSIHEFPPIGRLFLFFVVVPILALYLHLLYIGMNDIVVYTYRYVARTFLRGMGVLAYTLAVHIVLSLGATYYYLSQKSSMK